MPTLRGLRDGHCWENKLIDERVCFVFYGVDRLFVMRQLGLQGVAERNHGEPHPA